MMKPNNDIKILLVEDTNFTRTMEHNILVDAGFPTIIEAIDGLDAIHKLKANPDIDMVLSDWNMPNKNGLELLQWIRKLHTKPDLPFIMATARGEKAQMEKAQEAGVSAFIVKPFSVDEVKEVLNQLTETPSKRLGHEKQSWYPQYDNDGKIIFNITHIQILDHLVLGMLQYLIQLGRVKPTHFRLQTHVQPNWNLVQESLENGEYAGAMILAPIAMDLYGTGTPIQTVCLAHRNGSTCVKKTREKSDTTENAQSEQSKAVLYKNKQFFIPHTLSIHHILAHHYFLEQGLKPGFAGDPHTDFFFEVVPPIKMPDFLVEHDSAVGYMVAEPLGTKSIKAGNADLVFYSGELWLDHPCCVVSLRSELIKDHPEAVQEFVSMLVDAGKAIHEAPAIAAEIAVQFLDPDKTLGLQGKVIKELLTQDAGIHTDNLYPKRADFEFIQNYMIETMNMGKRIDLNGFLNMDFIERVFPEGKPSSQLVRLMEIPANRE